MQLFADIRRAGVDGGSNLLELKDIGVIEDPGLARGLRLGEAVEGAVGSGRMKGKDIIDWHDTAQHALQEGPSCPMA